MNRPRRVRVMGKPLLQDTQTVDAGARRGEHGYDGDRGFDLSALGEQDLGRPLQGGDAAPGPGGEPGKQVVSQASRGHRLAADSMGTTKAAMLSSPVTSSTVRCAGTSIPWGPLFPGPAEPQKLIAAPRGSRPAAPAAVDHHEGRRGRSEISEPHRSST
jgi:hypothetical protein